LSSAQFATVFSVIDRHRHDLRMLGDAIRELREQYRLTADDLCANAGLSPSQLAELEDGRLDPDLELIAAIARALGVRTSEIFIRAEQLAARGPAQEPGPQ
jgi:transcriptional regulator with XRE-family HTH domain